MNPLVASQGAGTSMKVRAVTYNIGGTEDYSKQREAFMTKLDLDIKAMVVEGSPQVFFFQEVGRHFIDCVVKALPAFDVRWAANMVVAVPGSWEVVSADLLKHFPDEVDQKDKHRCWRVFWPSLLVTLTETLGCSHACT